MNSLPKQPIFHYFAPKGTFKALISIPHSGEIVPDEFKKYLLDDFREISIDVDTAVDKLIDIDYLNSQGIGVLVANIHRACIDLNRSTDLAVLAWKKNSQGHQIVLKEPSQETRELYLEKYHTPYFTFLKGLIEDLEERYERPSVVDLHSMPSKATEYHLAITPNQKVDRPDFCLSDISGISCEKDFIETITKQLISIGYTATNNDPYFGGYVTREIHRLFPKTNNIQIEICRRIYLDETTRELVPELSTNLKKQLTKEFDIFFKGLH
jgi:N-formylglutamate amidohydrolase